MERACCVVWFKAIVFLRAAYRALQNQNMPIAVFHLSSRIDTTSVTNYWQIELYIYIHIYLYIIYIYLYLSVCLLVMWCLRRCHRPAWAITPGAHLSPGASTMARRHLRRRRPAAPLLPLAAAHAPNSATMNPPPPPHTPLTGVAAPDTAQAALSSLERIRAELRAVQAELRQHEEPTRHAHKEVISEEKKDEEEEGKSYNEMCADTLLRRGEEHRPLNENTPEKNGAAKGTRGTASHGDFPASPPRAATHTSKNRVEPAGAPAAAVDELDADIHRRLRLRHRPRTASMLESAEVKESVRDARALMQRHFANDAAEVLRSLPSREDAVRLARLAFPHVQLASEGVDVSQLAQLAAQLQRRVADEQTRLRADEGQWIRHALQNTDNKDASESTTEMRECNSHRTESTLPNSLWSEMAWLSVLNDLSDAELHRLYRYGILDVDCLEALLWSDRPTAHHPREVAEAAAPADESSESVAAPSRARNTTAPSMTTTESSSPSGECPSVYRLLMQSHKEKEDHPESTHTIVSNEVDDESPLVTLMNDTMQAIHRVEYAGGLVSEICNSALRGWSVPIDIASAVHKVMEDRHGEVSAAELKRLEAYEEEAVTIPVHTLQTHRPPPSSASAPYGASCFSFVPAGCTREDNKTRPAATTAFTSSLLDRALMPSNRLLHLVARRDARVQRTLADMERVRREALLDEEFQRSLALARVMDGDGAAAGWTAVSSSSSMGDANRARPLSSSPRRTGRGAGRMPPSLTQRSHAADVPFFYGSRHSYVPPRGRFNVPEPALSAQERAARRGQRRRARGPTRFAT